MRHTHLVLCLSLGLGLLGPGCDKTDTGKDGGSGDGPAVTPDIGAPPPGLVTFKNKGEEASLTVASGGELLIVPYSVSDVAADSIAFDIKITAGGSGADAGVESSSFPLKLQRSRLTMRNINPDLWARWQRRLAVEAWSRQLAVDAASMRLAPKHPPMTQKTASCAKSSECGATEVCSAGTCSSSLTIKTEVFSTTKTITADVKKKGTIAAILVDSNDTVADGDLTTMLEKFEKVIYTRDVGFFGNPALKSGTLSSDRNADGLIWIVMTKKVKDKNAVGFFVATDFTDDAKSNKADILYVDSAAKLADTYTIMAHELEHLLNFGAKVYRPEADGGAKGALEALWLDEGQAHFAEEACGFGGENVTLLRQEVYPNFDSTALFESTKDGLAMRGMAMTFVRYLFEQKGGATYNGDGSITDKGGAKMLAALHTSTAQGTAAVTAAYGDFKTAFDYWIVAMALDGRGVTTYGKYVYQELVDDPLASGTKIGLKIRGSRKDNTGASVNLEGPNEDSITGDKSDTIPNATGKFFKLTGKTGDLKIKVTTPDTDFRFVVIKLK
jgi:hypothetical protein